MFIYLGAMLKTLVWPHYSEQLLGEEIVKISKCVRQTASSVFTEVTV